MATDTPGKISIALHAPKGALAFIRFHPPTCAQVTARRDCQVHVGAQSIYVPDMTPATIIGIANAPELPDCDDAISFRDIHADLRLFLPTVGIKHASVLVSLQPYDYNFDYLHQRFRYYRTSFEAHHDKLSEHSTILYSTRNRCFVEVLR